MGDTDKPSVRVFKRTGGVLKSEVRPIVLNYKNRKKRKKPGIENEGSERYSAGFEDIQRLEKDAIQIARRSARAISKGLDSYDQERDKSARSKKDGAIEDFVYNSGTAVSTTLKEMSGIPLDIAESINTKNYRSRLRKNLKRTSRFIRLFRL